MRISIIIPHLNQPHFLLDCLTALAPQVKRAGNCDLTVVDNGSADLPTAICSAFPGVRLIAEAKPGPGPARNAGIAASQGELLAFIDADCLPHSDWLQTISAGFAAHPEWQVIGGDVRIRLKDPLRPDALEAYESVFAYRQKEYIEKKGFSGTGNLAMRRSAYEAVGPFAGIDVAEDREWGRRATALGIRIAYVPEMIVYHPARSLLRDLQKKWDRHISHDFAELGGVRAPRLRWALRALAVMGSGLADIRKVLGSDRLRGVRTRILASFVLVKIRTYRAWKMLLLLTRPNAAASHWNRE